MSELSPPPVAPAESPPAPEPAGPETGARQSFIWALVAGFVPVCGLPVVWGLVAIGRRKNPSPTYRRWFQRLVALAILDTLVAGVCLHMAVVGRHDPESARLSLGPPKVLGVLTDSKYPGPGVKLSEVKERGPAKGAGLQVGDVVHQVDGQPIDSSEALRKAVQAAKPGVALQVEVEHEGARREVRLLPVEASALDPAPRGLFEPVNPEEPVMPRELRNWIGMWLVMGALLALWGVGRRRGADWRPLGVMAVLVAAGLGSLVTMKGLSALLGGPSRGAALVSVWVQALVIVLVSWLIVRRTAPGTEAPAGQGWFRTYLVSLGLFITLGMRVLMLLVWFSQVAGVLPNQNQHPMMEMAREGPLGALGWVLFIIPAALLAPVGEELLFRGVLLPWLTGWMGRVAALVLSAGLFASLHLFYGVFTGWIFFLGLMLGWARLTSGQLRPSMLLHATVNSFALVMFARSLGG
ncbi:MAG: type II CAAX prenyl endopeptidase Rce1 family protein [Hyalangium sp.]|uniref:CPBP family glutamic-type intramembrane protease n=1 Tax=Hyalangium sp. TaxID=2028555 RepID=UPI00389AD4A4